jgi:hypothetical protein
MMVKPGKTREHERLGHPPKGGIVSRSLVLPAAALLCFSCGIAPRLACASAQARPTVQQLFRELQARPTCDQAESELRELGTADSNARHFLALQLPALIEADPAPTQQERDSGVTVKPTWSAAVRLAGELKIVEAAPALAKWITISTSRAISLGIGEEALVDSPAGQALVRIGDPSVPILQGRLSLSSQRERYHAAYVLNAINSGKADKALSEYVAEGRDRDLAAWIRNVLENKSGNSTR